MYQIIGIKTQIFFEKKYTTRTLICSTDTEEECLEKYGIEFYKKGNLFHSDDDGRFDNIIYTDNVDEFIEVK